MRPLLSTSRAEGWRLGRPLLDVVALSGASSRAGASSTQVSEEGLGGLCHHLQLQVVVLVIFLFALAGRRLVLAASVLRAALVRVTRSSSAGCCGEARPAPCHVVDAETTDRVRVQGLLA